MYDCRESEEYGKVAVVDNRSGAFAVTPIIYRMNVIMTYRQQLYRIIHGQRRLL